MRLDGEYRFSHPPEQVWAALHDAAVLREAIPGVEALTVESPGRFRIAVSVGVGAVRGNYAGTLELTDVRPGTECLLRADASGSQGSVDATVRVNLEPGDGETLIRYDADAAVVGRVAGVGQRLIGAVAKRLTNDFFANVEQQLATGGTVPPTATTPPKEAQAPYAISSGTGRRLDPLSLILGAGIALVSAIVGHYL